MFIGTISYTNITVTDAPQMIKGRVRLYQENLFLEMAETSALARLGVKQWAHIQPIPHFINLFENIAAGNYIELTDGVQAINNFFMLQYETPIQVFDTALLTSYTEEDIFYPTPAAPVTSTTTAVTQVFYLPPTLTIQLAQQLLASAAKMFTQINGGSATITLEEATQ